MAGPRPVSGSTASVTHAATTCWLVESVSFMTFVNKALKKWILPAESPFHRALILCPRIAQTQQVNLL